MAEDQFQSSGGGNWWESAARNNMRYESGGAPQSSSSGITNIGGGGGNSNNFVNWQQQQDVAAAEHMKATTRSSMDSSGGGGSSVVFHHHDPHKLHPPDHSSDPNLHMMGLGLSSPSSLDWDQPSLLRGGDEKGSENSFRSMLQENLGSSKTNFQQDHHQSGGGMGLSSPQQFQWRDPSSTTNNNNNRGFSLDQNQFSPQYSPGESTITSQQGLHHQHHHPSISSPFQNIGSTSLYGSPSSILMQGLLGPDHNSNSQQAAMNFPFPSMSYGLSSNSGSDLVVPSNSWLNNSKASQFLRGSTPANNQLHFTNNAPFWNASESSAATIKDVRSTGFFPSLQPSFSNTPNFDVQSKNMSEVRNSGGVVKKSGCEQTAKRPRNETASPLPAFKVRKEKMGDRITALQQLVSPFGKTDTASVLSEAIEYIKFLHEQVTVLSTPYIKSGAPIQQIQQSSGKSKEGEGPKQDLRSRGLCLVPVSSTFPVTHETTVDFWTPTFGGDSR